MGSFIQQYFPMNNQSAAIGALASTWVNMVALFGLDEEVTVKDWQVELMCNGTNTGWGVMIFAVVPDGEVAAFVAADWGDGATWLKYRKYLWKTHRFNYGNVVGGGEHENVNIEMKTGTMRRVSADWTIVTGLYLEDTSTAGHTYRVVTSGSYKIMSHES